MRVKLRPMVRRDVELVAATYILSFPDGDVDAELTLMGRYLRRPGAPLVYRVAETDQRKLFVGYCCYRRDPNKLFLNAVAVHPTFRRKKFGSAIVADVALRMSPLRTAVETVVRERVDRSHLPACNLLAACGFASDLIRGWQGDADAFRFVRHLKQDALVAAETFSNYESRKGIHGR